MGWKIYSTLFLGAAILRYGGNLISYVMIQPSQKSLPGGSMLWIDGLYFPFTVVSLLGLFGFTYKKLRWNQPFWKAWFVVILIVDTLVEIGFHYSGIWNFSKNSFTTYLSIIYIVLNIPLYFALYFYGYKSDSIWNPQPTAPQ